MRRPAESLFLNPVERRWLLVVVLLLLLAVMLPLAGVLLNTTRQPEWVFMGGVLNYQDTATYLAKIQLGRQGEWQTRFLHTSEPHRGAFLQVLYPLLGQAARVLGLSAWSAFHVGRLLAATLMFLALYLLGASVWQRERPRHLFFLIAVLGGGFGWWLAPLTGRTDFPDLAVPEMFPLASALANVHFPLTFACLALMALIVLQAFRPGQADPPTVRNGGLTLLLCALALALLYPQALVTFAGGLGLLVALDMLFQRKVRAWALRWLAAAVLPAVPVALYYGAVLAYHPVFGAWNVQNVTPSPPVWVLVAGLGLPLLLAVPGIVRALRRFEADGDQFMVLWLIVILLLMFLPTPLQRRYSAGLMIPLAYFATRALEDYWLPRLAPAWRGRGVALLLALLPLSFVLVGVASWAQTRAPATSPMYLSRDYVEAFAWLDEQATANAVVLAAPVPSAWLPGRSGLRVVYGHPFETLDAEARRDEVLAWYAGDGNTPCDALLSAHSVRYVLLGPQERALGAGTCTETLRAVQQFGDVAIFAR